MKKLLLVVLMLAGCSKSPVAPEMVTVVAINPYGEVVGDTTYYFTDAVINGGVMAGDTFQVRDGSRLIAQAERMMYVGGYGLVDTVEVSDTTIARPGLVWKIEYNL